MKLEMYSVKDEIHGFLQPTFSLYEPAAVRDFRYAVNQPGMMNFSPDDYSLYFVGTFDTENGFVDFVDPKLIIKAREVIE